MPLRNPFPPELEVIIKYVICLAFNYQNKNMMNKIRFYYDLGTVLRNWPIGFFRRRLNITGPEELCVSVLESSHT